MTHALLLTGLLIAAWRFTPELTEHLRAERPDHAHLALLIVCCLLMIPGWPLWIVWRVLLKPEQS
ncbi:hypothetical protein [Deinococcus sp. 6GRE01]|uniref:hypothetical protein n=1 Tax=Deinococcus sp. 6GRE01 TaxID=2745873 RepID=UPI001E577C29|nr:hypothetical protein [Deinococcus sp. 6GRE01]MCD0156253.1 hypothetical protein [Deinococcus sp. 6GRE01]